MVQWLRLCAPNARGTASIPGWRTEIPHATRHGKKKKKKEMGKRKVFDVLLLKKSFMWVKSAICISWEGFLG